MSLDILFEAYFQVQEKMAALPGWDRQKEENIKDYFQCLPKTCRKSWPQQSLKFRRLLSDENNTLPTEKYGSDSG